MKLIGLFTAAVVSNSYSLDPTMSGSNDNFFFVFHHNFDRRFDSFCPLLLLKYALFRISKKFLYYEIVFLPLFLKYFFSFKARAQIVIKSLTTNALTIHTFRFSATALFYIYVSCLLPDFTSLKLN